MSLGSLLEKKQPLISKTAGVDCFIPSMVRMFGISSAGAVVQYLRQAYDTWPEEVWRIVHLSLEKTEGNAVNVYMRPNKLMSALFWLQAKMLAPSVM